MAAALKKTFRAVREFILKKIGRRKRRNTSAIVHQPRSRLQTISPEKREKLQKLCEQLLKHKDFITSGRLQLIGLEAVRKKLGKQWVGLASVVYEIVETVMQEHLDPDDLFVRYKEDTYSIIFARAGLAEGQMKAAAIAQGIRAKLFALDESDLKSLEIREAVKRLQMSIGTGDGFPDFLDALTIGWADDEGPPTQDDAPAPADEAEEGPEIAVQEVETSAYRLRAETFKPETLAGLHSRYLPLWDVKRGALTTYLCLMAPEGDAPSPVEAHVSLYKGQTTEGVLALDLHTLKTVMAELGAMEADGRKLLIGCPVNYKTLYSFDSYEEYKALLAAMPQAHKPFLVFYVMGVPEALPAKDPFWFGVPLQQFAREIMVEIPLSKNAPFSLLRSAGIRDVSVRLMQGEDEQESIKALNYFAQRADSFKMGRLGVLGVPSLSLTTSSICAGFELIGGGAIHAPVLRPDSIHRYQQEDLLKAFMTQK